MVKTVAYDLILLGEDASASNDPDAKIIAAMSQNGRDPLALLERYRTAAERSYYKAHRELMANRRAAKKEEMAVTEQIIRASMYGPTPGELQRLTQASSPELASAVNYPQRT